MTQHQYGRTPRNGGGRNFLASVIGWVLVAIVAWYLFGFVIGTIKWDIRTVLILLVIGGLAWAYVTLKTEKH